MKLSGVILRKKELMIWLSYNNINEFEPDDSKELNTEKIGTVLASGSSSPIKTYTFSDKTNSSRNVSLYRIKMIDKNGAFAYSETKSVKGSSAKSDFVVFPNPCLIHPVIVFA